MRSRENCSCKKISDCKTATEVCAICKRCIMLAEAKTENEPDDRLFGEE